MIKNLTLLLFSLLIFQAVKAQKTSEKLLYYLDRFDNISTVENATYCMYIMPLDTVTGLSAIKEYYPNNQLKLSGNSSNRKFDMLCFEGNCVAYNQNGKLIKRSNYVKGSLNGNDTTYYPNGNLYMVETYTNTNEVLLLECRDSVGVVLAKNGNGKWIKFDGNFKETEEGMVKDSLEDGVWKGMSNGSPKYTTVYSKEQILSTTDPNNVVGERIFLSPRFTAIYSIDKGFFAFEEFLAKNVIYPASAREDNIQGKVVVKFIIEKDGSVTNVKAIEFPSKDLAQAVITVVQQSRRWFPALQNGEPVRAQYTIPFKFETAIAN